MKIQFCSDLHLEFPDNKALLTAYPIKPLGDILILAGDIVPFTLIKDHKDFFDYISDHFKQTYWIPGNHEYYHSDAGRYTVNFIEKIRDNISLVNNQAIILDGVKIIFTTLWSSISIENQWHMHHSMTDFRVIRFNGELFSTKHFNALHDECKSFLISELNINFSGKTVVVTHHVPTLLNYPAKYKTSVLNQAFAVEMYDVIENSKIDFWLYGHSHINTPEFIIGKTQLLTNQLGYVSHFEHQQFQKDRIILF